MATTIDSLQLEIQSNSTNAADGIDSLAKALKKLDKNSNISNAVTNLNNLRKALHAFVNMPSNASKIDSLAKSLKSLSKIGKIDIGDSLASVKRSMESLGAINVDGVAPQIERIAGALAPLSSVSGSGFNNMMNGLKKLGDVADSLDDDTITRFVDKVKKLDSELGPLSTKMTAFTSALKASNDSTLSASGGLSIFGNKVNTTTLNLQSMISVAKDFVASLQPVINLLKNTISQAIEWEGIAARFGRGFGDQADEVYSWVKRLNQEMGLNVQQFMQYSSVFSTMLQGFGVGTEDAGKMALGYTELIYDIWAGYNDVYKNFSDAAEAVKSAIAGEVEPIRRAGFTIVEATLEQTAANHGLEISLENATEAQKSYLRYQTLVDQAYSQNLVGTYAAEMNTAEGMMRTFTQQLKSLSQAFGSVFLPALTKVMPWIQAFITLLNEAVMAVARFFGVTIQPVSFGKARSGIDGVAKSAGAAGGALGSAAKAAEDLKNATLGIDELNVITPPTDTGGGGGGGGGAADFDWDVDSLWDESIFAKIQFEVEEIKGKLKEALSGITALVSGFSLAIGAILVTSGANIPLGIGLMAIGAVGLVAATAANWNTMSEKLAETLTTITSVLGGFLLAIGAFLAFSGVNIGLGAALMVAGATSLATAVTINWKFLEGDMKNTLSILTGIVSGGLLAMGALFAFTGVAIPLGIALMAAGAVGLATAAALNWDSLSEPMRKAIGTLEAIVGGGLLAFGAILTLTGVNVPLGVAMIAAGAVSIISAAVLNWDSMTSDVKNSLATISTIVGGALLGIGAILALTGVATPLGIAMIAAGAIGIVAAAPINWSSLVTTIKKVTKEIGAALGLSLLAVGAVLAFSGVALPLGIAIMAAGAVSLASSVALNWDSIKTAVQKAVNSIGDWLQKYGLLALGAVLCLTGAGIPLGIALIKKGLSTKTEGGSTVGNDLLKTIKEKWNAIKEWWNSKPELKEISTKVGDIKSKVSSAWTTAKNWWDKNKPNMATYTPSIGDIKSKLSSAWTTAKTWWDRSKPGFTKYTPSIGSIKDKLVSAWNTAKNWWDKNVRLSIPSLSFKVTYTPPSGLGAVKKAIVKALDLPGWPKLSFAKDGGMFDMGSLIWAGEAGAEIVANAGGGKTGVMNVDQMQNAVYEGVYSAVVAAMRANSGDGGGQSVNVYLDGRQITASVEKRQRESGVSLVGKQLYAY